MLTHWVSFCPNCKIYTLSYVNCAPISTKVLDERIWNGRQYLGLGCVSLNAFEAIECLVLHYTDKCGASRTSSFFFANNMRKSVDEKNLHFLFCS